MKNEYKLGWESAISTAVKIVDTALLKYAGGNGKANADHRKKTLFYRRKIVQALKARQFRPTPKEKFVAMAEEAIDSYLSAFDADTVEGLAAGLKAELRQKFNEA